MASKAGQSFMQDYISRNYSQNSPSSDGITYGTYNPATNTTSYGTVKGPNDSLNAAANQIISGVSPIVATTGSSGYSNYAPGSIAGSATGSAAGNLNSNVNITDTIQNMINQLKQAQISAITGKLDTAKNNALSRLTTQRNALDPTYTGLKNQAKTRADISAKNFAEYMANRPSSTGSAQQMALMNNVAMNNQISGLDMAKQQELQGLTQQENDINNNYNSDLVAAQQGIEADAMAKSISVMQQAQAQAEADRKYQEQQAWQKLQYDNAQKQQTLENTLKQQQLENALKQQEFENQMAMQQFALAQAKASNTGGGSGYSGGGSKGTYSASDMSKAANSIYDNLAANNLGDAYNWLSSNQQQLIADIGLTEYNRLLGKMNNALTVTGQQYGRGGYSPVGEDPALRYLR